MAELRTLRGRARPVLVMAVACFRADRARALASLGLRSAGALSGPVFAAALASLVTSARPGVALSTSLGAAALLAASLGGQIVLDELGWKVTQVLEERTAHHVDLEILNMVAGRASPTSSTSSGPRTSTRSSGSAARAGCCRCRCPRS